MISVQILGVISILTVFVCVLLATFLLVAPTKRRLPNILFAAFLLLTAFDMSIWFWQGSDLAKGWFNAFRQAVGWLQMPLFLGFIVASCYSQFRLKWAHLIHALPFVVFLYLSLPGDQLSFASEENQASFYSENERMLRFICSHIQYYAYIFVAVITLYKFREVFKNQYSDSRSSVFMWLTQLVAVSLFAHTLILVRELAGISGFQATFSFLQAFGALLVLVVMSWVTFKALLQPEIFRGIDKTLQRASTHLTNSDNGVNQEGNTQKNRLHNFMLERQLFLDPELSLANLSEQLVLPQRELSELLNQKLGVRFFDFINSYRIEHAKSLLLENPKSSVLEVLYASGFNSKSSFNTAFKKHTGTTPTAFRRQQLI